MRHVAAITLKAIPAMNRKAFVSLLSLFMIFYFLVCKFSYPAIALKIWCATWGTIAFP